MIASGTSVAKKATQPVCDADTEVSARVLEEDTVAVAFASRTTVERIRYAAIDGYEMSMCSYP